MPTAPLPEVAGAPELAFADGLPGFPGPRRFTLERWGGDNSPFSILQCLEDPSLRFVVVPPGAFFPDYEPVLSDEDTARLQVHRAEDAIVLVIVTLGERADDATANLLGPVVVNRHTLAAAQIVLTGQDLPTRRRLSAA